MEYLLSDLLFPLIVVISGNLFAYWLYRRKSNH